MRHLLAIAFAAASFPAFAADLPPRVPIKAPTFVQSVSAPGGFYFGAFIGGGMAKESFDFVTIPGTGNLNPTGVQVGAKIGYGVWMSPNMMLGLEVDAAYDINRETSNPCAAAMLTCSSQGSWLFTQRVVLGWRLGSGITAATGGKSPDQWPVPLSLPANVMEARIVPYLTGGVAERRIEAEVVGFGAAKEWLVGWTVGGGIKIPVSTAVSIDVGYLYINYHKNFVPADTPPIFPANFKATSEHIARAAVTLGF